MAQQWAENNSEIAFEIVCSLDLKKQTKKLSVLHANKLPTLGGFFSKQCWQSEKPFTKIENGMKKAKHLSLAC